MATFNLATLRSITVLYVEDEQMIREQTKKAFDKLFKTTLVASNGEEAFEIFTQNKDTIDIVITDINMPKLSGIELSKKLLDLLYVPILITSAYSNKEYLLEAMSLGVKKYLTKPTTLNSIVQDIEKIVTEHRKELEVKEIAKILLVKSKNTDILLGKILAKNKIIESELTYYKNIVNNYVSMLKIDKNGIIIDISSQLSALLKYEDSELLGVNISTIKSSSCENETFQKQMLQAIHKKTSVQSINAIETKTKKLLQFEIKLELFYGEDSLVAGYNLYFNLISL
jgi:YesN/AraC family two-component response regulator